MFGMTGAQWRALLAARSIGAAPTKRARPAATRREPVKWRLLPDSLFCTALTKSEARAKFKEMLDVKGRLPHGRMVVRAAPTKQKAA